MSEPIDPAGSLGPELAAGLRKLSSEGIEPPRDLWPGLEQEWRRSRRRSHRAFAAAASILVGLLVAGSWWTMRDPAPVSLHSVRNVAPPSASSSPAHARYLEKRREVMDSIAVALADYPLESRDEIRRNIHEIERAIEGIEQTLASRPAGPELETRQADILALELRLLRLVDERLRTGGLTGWEGMG